MISSVRTLSPVARWLCSAALFSAFAAAFVAGAGPATSATSAAPSTAPATAPASKPTTGRAESADYDLYEWAIFIQDATQQTTNSESLYSSSLPEFIKSSRPTATGAPSTQPSPIGLIRLVGGRPADGGKIDVVLALKSGQFHAHWPPSRGRSDRLLWDDIDVLDAAPAVMQEVKADHWYSLLRQGASAYLRRRQAADQFLLYDAELNEPVKLRVSPGGGPGIAYHVQNTGLAPVLKLHVYKPAEKGWRVAGIDRLDPAPGQAGPATKPAAPPPPPDEEPGPNRRRRSLIENLLGLGGGGPPPQADAAAEPPSDSPAPSSAAPAASSSSSSSSATYTAAPATAPSAPITAPATSPAAASITGPATSPSGHPATSPTSSSRPTTAPATQPAGIPVRFADATAYPAAEALASWKADLAAAGLPPTDLPLIMTLLEQQGLDTARPTLIYLLDRAEMDRLLPLEVTPLPRKPVRVGLVIVRNAGPELQEEIDRLIAQLGDENWSKREEAQKRLTQIGAAASTKLQEAQNQKDVEIAWRAERLLKVINTPKGQNRGGMLLPPQ